MRRIKPPLRFAFAAASVLAAILVLIAWIQSLRNVSYIQYSAPRHSGGLYGRDQSSLAWVVGYFEISHDVQSPMSKSVSDIMESVDRRDGRWLVRIPAEYFGGGTTLFDVPWSEFGLKSTREKSTSILTTGWDLRLPCVIPLIIFAILPAIEMFRLIRGWIRKSRQRNANRGGFAVVVPSKE